MATTNNVVLANQINASVASTPPSVFNTIWMLTRAMKKAGWKYKASGDGTSKDTSSAPNSDLWGNAGTTSNPGAAAASITANARGRATVTGLSGITSLDKGRFLQITGSGSGNNGYHQIEEIISSSSVKIDARTATITAPDVNNGALTWTIQDPTGTTYPSALNSVAAWWCAQGPSILRIPITALPAVGPGGFTFLRGENIVQATTGFEGEIIGFVFDSGAGYLTVAPRLRGTGGGVFGLATGNAFTGASSGATVTQNGTALEYRYEVTVWKAANVTAGLIFITQPEPVAEGATNLFSTLASAAGCTATVAPGGGGTGNAFPTQAWVALGSGTAVASATNWCGNSTSVHPYGNSQIVAVDCLEEQNYSADGSWIWTLACFGGQAPAGGGHKILSFQRLDDIEDGDLAPYVSFVSPQVKTLSGQSRTSAGATESAAQLTAADAMSLTAQNNAAATRVCLGGWYRRGLTSDAFREFETAALIAVQSGTTFMMAQNVGQGDSIATAPVATSVREPVWVVSLTTGFKQRKGTFRWIYAVGPGGSVGKFYDAKKWVQLSSGLGALVIGPWDGATSILMS
jgi:hypothetical protein